MKSDADHITQQNKKFIMEKLIQFFGYEHLPTEELRNASKPFHDLAQWMLANLPPNPESTVAMRKLLEAKDCGVRSRVYK